MFENTEITLEIIKLPTFMLCLNDETLLILLEIFLKLLRQYQLSYFNNLTVLIILANTSLPNGTTD